GLSFEEQTLRDVWKRVGVAPRLRHRAFERLVVRGEVAQRAVLVAFRDIGAAQAFAADVVAPAVAADHPPWPAAHVVTFRLPAGIITKRARHRQSGVSSD